MVNMVLQLYADLQHDIEAELRREPTPSPVHQLFTGAGLRTTEQYSSNPMIFGIIQLLRGRLGAPLKDYL